MVITVENGIGDPTLDESVHVSLVTNALVKGMNPFVLLQLWVNTLIMYKMHYFSKS